MKKNYALLLSIVFCSLVSAQVKIGTMNYSKLGAAFNAINSGTHTGLLPSALLEIPTRPAMRGCAKMAIGKFPVIRHGLPTAVSLLNLWEPEPLI